MEVRIVETQKAKELVIIDEETGVEWTQDCLNMGQYWNEETEEHEMSEAEYERAVEYIENYPESENW